jgi:hypothetical protein
VYLGYGVFGGIGWGLGYVAPVSTLMRWFPDRRGLATGMQIRSAGVSFFFCLFSCVLVACVLEKGEICIIFGFHDLIHN